MPQSIHQTNNLTSPALSNGFYTESYRLRKAASSMTKSVLRWFKDHSRMFVERYLTTQQEANRGTFCLLSVGSGEGDLDWEII